MRQACPWGWCSEPGPAYSRTIFTWHHVVTFMGGSFPETLWLTMVNLSSSHVSWLDRCANRRSEHEITGPPLPRRKMHSWAQSVWFYPNLPSRHISREGMWKTKGGEKQKRGKIVQVLRKRNGIVQLQSKMVFNEEWNAMELVAQDRSRIIAWMKSLSQCP